MNNWVTIKRDRVDEALAWAKANCPHYITNDYHMCGYNLYDENLIDFYFMRSEAGEKEMLMFALKWL